MSEQKIRIYSKYPENRIFKFLPPGSQVIAKKSWSNELPASILSNHQLEVELKHGKLSYAYVESKPKKDDVQPPKVEDKKKEEVEAPKNEKVVEEKKDDESTPVNTPKKKTVTKKVVKKRVSKKSSSDTKEASGQLPEWYVKGKDSTPFIADNPNTADLKSQL